MGDFAPGELRRLVNQYFAAVPSHAAAEAPRCDAAASGKGPIRREVHDARANLDALLRIYRVPEHRSADTPALEILNVIVGQGESSRLNVAVVRREKAAVAAGSLLDPSGSRNGPGIWVAYGIVNQGVGADRMDSIIGLQLDTIRTNGVTPDELEKAKNLLRAGFIANRETTFGKAEELHHYRTFHNSIEEINTDLDRILAVTSDDVKRVANTYLAPGNLTLLIVRAGAGPASGGGQ